MKARDIAEGYGEEKHWGLILPDGKIVEKFNEYYVGAHTDLARALGYEDSSVIVKEGGARFATYLGGVNFSPGFRIEYDLVSWAKSLPTIAKHINEHTSSGGYSLLFLDNVLFANIAKGPDFKQFRNAAQAIKYINQLKGKQL